MISPALSTTQAVSTWLTTAVSPRVLHVFERVCNLVDGERRVLSLVAPEIGRGPFSLVMALGNGRFTDFIQADSQVFPQPHELHLQVGALAVDTSAAQVWNPRPFWESIPPSAIQTCLPLFEGKLAASSPDSLAHFNGHFDKLSAGRFDATAQKVKTAVHTLQLGLENGDLAACEEGAQNLAGLGVGLTPAGDDFLLGTIYGLWLKNDGAAKFQKIGAACRGGSRTAPTSGVGQSKNSYHKLPETQRMIEAIAETAAARTTTLSAAWLRAAARGEAGEPWHVLVTALRDSGETATSTRSMSAVSQAIDRILATGHTSGADALAGFVWGIRCVMRDA
ncbi:MAG: DUF2877 domain-containing protein [Chloroflexota bacterium]